MTDTQADFLIIGGGIVGLSAGYHLAAAGDVVVLEAEAAPCSHASGRSAAVLVDGLGGPAIWPLNRYSRAFMSSPPEGFAGTEILRPCGVVVVGREDQPMRALAAELAAGRGDLGRLSLAEAATRWPILNADGLRHALWDPHVDHIESNLLADGYARLMRAAGGRVVTDARLASLSRDHGVWRAGIADGRLFTAPVVINAAGAWADRVAALAGLSPLGLVPKRRTAIIIDAPAETDPRAWPMLLHADEGMYIKPEGGKLLVSPGDETPSAPVDAAPEEMDIAIAADFAERLTGRPVRHIRHKWAGLRSFFPDALPAVGVDPRLTGFAWCAGLGGFGVQTSPAIGRLIADLVLGRDLGHWQALSADPGAFDPARLITA